MRDLIAISAASIFLLFSYCAYAQENLEPEVFTLSFSPEIEALLDEDTPAQRPEEWPDWILGIGQNNGAIVGEAWKGKPGNFEIETTFSVFIDNKRLTSDLALTLSFSTETECDFAIQVFDENDQVVAIDLFGNVSENSVNAGTDTYIVPLVNYPSASRISIRQVSGELILFGMLAFPVLSELPADPEAELSMLELLGGELSRESRLYKALYELIPAGEQADQAVSRDEVIASMRAEILKDFAQTEAELEKSLIGTEWYLDDRFGGRLGRFLPEGTMHQQVKREARNGEYPKWKEGYPIAGRRYMILSGESILFGIGGWMAKFNEDFTKMTYASKGGKQGYGIFTGRFDPAAELQKLGKVEDYSGVKASMTKAALGDWIVGTQWQITEYSSGLLQSSGVFRMKARGLVERRGSEGEWTRIAIYGVRDDGSMSYGKFRVTTHFDSRYQKFSGVDDDGTRAVVGQLIGRSEKGDASSSNLNTPVDPIVALLRMPSDQVEAALARMGIVKNSGSLEVEDKVSTKSGKPYKVHSYDSGKVKFVHQEGKLIRVELRLSEGYEGALPLGLDRNMGHKEARTATEGREYIRTSHGYTSSGWGSVFSSEYPLSHGVFVETKSRKSKELELVRVYARSDPD